MATLHEELEDRRAALRVLEEYEEEFGGNWQLSRRIGDLAFALRKRFGGWMRQAGILAAAGIFALQNNVTRLADDHQHAGEIAARLEARFPGRVRQATNMVFLDIDPSELKRLLAHMNEHGVRLSRERWVLHRDVSDRDVQTILSAISAF